jgi:tetratricopeptide (TPR) repeat protein
MKLPRFASIFCLILAGALAPRLVAQERPRQQAKDLAEKADREGNDRAMQVQDICAAAQLEPKNKKYQDSCNSDRSGLLQDDTAALAIAFAAYRNHDLNAAEKQAKLVSSYDQKLSGNARVLLDRIGSDRLINQVQEAWKRGDFQSVVSLAQAVTNPDLKASANVYVNNVNLYNGYIDQAGKVAQSDPQEAIRQLTLATNLNPNGPGNPSGMIADLQKAKQTKSNPAPLTPTPKTAADSPAEIAKKVTKFMGDARNAEQQGDPQGAINFYGMALKLQPGNKDAQSNLDRLQLAIKNDPAAAKNELTSAIRYFYRSQFADAEREFRDYLKSPQTAQNPGAANFYLGATLLEESMLTTPASSWQGPSADVLSAFKEARKASYNPVRTYVSPALLKVWDAATQSPLAVGPPNGSWLYGRDATRPAGQSGSIPALESLRERRCQPDASALDDPSMGRHG